MTQDEAMFAINDARHRQAALVSLIDSIESQAGGLLRLYVTLGLAAASAAGAALSGQFLLPVEAIVGLTVAVVMLLVGSSFCFGAMKSAPITLPGRGPDFWIWASRPNVMFLDAAVVYLQELDARQKRDRALNELTAKRLASAKKIGLLTPIAALVASAVVSQIR